MGNYGRPGRPNGRPSTLNGPKLPKTEGNTHVYLIRSLHLVKVGLAENVYLRYSNVRVNNPHGSELLIWWELPIEVASIVDRCAKLELEEKHAVGDWYNVTDEEAIAAIERVINWQMDIAKQRAARSRSDAP